ncbi:MAG TPA: AIR synthase family protein [Bacillota bacterium]|nr:AIR synthase family protein [Bacillota bacterium]
MKSGKLTPEELRVAVFDKVTFVRPETLVTAAIGEDSAVLDLAGDLCVVSTDPITGATAGAGRLAVLVSCNDVATTGAEPVGLLLTILAPIGTKLQQIADVMESAAQASAQLGVQIIGGHTEVTAAVNQMVLSTTVIGRVKPDKLLSVSLTRPGAELIMVRTAGLEGTAIIAADHKASLVGFMDEDMISRAASLAEEISVVQACRVAADSGAQAMHDVTEGGVLGAAYEMAQAAGLTLHLRKDIPVHPLTRVLCDGLGLDPLKLISSGTLLVASMDAEKTMTALHCASYPAFHIGCFSPGPAQVWLGNQLLAEPESDELWRFKSRLAGDHGES